MHVAQ